MRARAGQIFRTANVGPPEEYFVEDLHGITYREAAAPIAGLVISLFGLASLATAVAFLTQLNTWPLRAGDVMGWLAVVALLGFGGMTMALAVAAFTPQYARFERETLRVRGRVRGRLWLPTSVDIDAAVLGRPFVQASSRESGTDLHEVHVPWPGHPPLTLGSYADPTTAKYWQDQLTTFLPL